jgi:uncharacterized protein YjbJ (UPF0337 family)
MNRELLETQWPQVREILREKFSNLSEEDIRQINGRYDQLVTKIQQKYGYSREEAEERIRNWNFDRLATPRSQTIREERVRKEEDTTSSYMWFLAIGIPLILLASYFLFNNAKSPEETQPPLVNQEQVVAEAPADRAISNGLRDAFLAQPTLVSQIQNIQITTHNGVVTLSGFTTSKEMSDRLVNVAQHYAGVKQVVNDLQIK